MSWPLVKLGDVAPAKAKKKQVADSSSLAWQLNLDQVESHTGRVIDEIVAPISEAGNSTHWFDERHVLYSKLRPYLNKVVVPEKEGIATTELVPMLPDPDRLDRKYLAHYLRSSTFVNWVSVQVAGAKMPRVSMKVFWEHELPLPPIAEQKRIAAILDKADALRCKRQQAIDIADQFLRSVFLEMFGDPVTNPMGWPTKPLSQMASVITGYPFKSSDYIEESKGTVRLCRGANVLPGALDWKDTRFWSRDRLDGLDDYLLEQGDIILAMDRPWISSGLKVCHAEVSDIPTYLVQRVARIRAGTQSMQDLIYASIDSVAFERHCCPTETTIPHISPVELKAFPIFDVPADLLERFSRVVRTSLRKTKSFAFAEDQSEVLFSSISQQAFRGDL